MGARVVPGVTPQRRGAVALALGLAAVLIVATATPAHAAEVSVANPGSGSTVEGSTTVRVAVEADAVEQVEQVEARLRRGGDIVGSSAQLSHQAGDRSGGTSSWTTQWDPASGGLSGGQALDNGTYRIEARAHVSLPVGDDTTDWTGHDVTVSLPPATPTLRAETRDDGRTVALQWDEASAPDFTRYRLERAGQGGSFETVTEITGRGTTSYRDEPSGGTWRYRLTTARSDGAGGERTATSDIVTVEVDEGSSPTLTPTPGASPSPRPDADDDASENGDDPDGDGGDGQQGDGGEAGSGQPGLRGSGGGAPPPSGQGQVPALGEGEVEDEAEEPVADVPDGDGYDEELPYDLDGAGAEDGQGDEDPRVADSGRDVLTVAGRQLTAEEVLTPVAGGLLLFVTAGHLLRLRREEF